MSHWAGYSTVATALRNGSATRKRASATIKNSAKALYRTSWEKAVGPCRKKEGALRSRVPSGMVLLCQAWLVGRISTLAASRVEMRGFIPMLSCGTRMCPGPRASLTGENAAGSVHALQSNPAAAHHAGQRVFSHQYGQAGFLGQQAVEIAQQSAAAGQHHAALGDVGAEFRRRLLQRILDGRDDLVERLGQSLQHFVAGNGETARHALAEVAPTHFHLAHFGAREGAADLLLDGFRRGLADQHAVVATDVTDDGFVKLVAADTHAALVDHAAERNHAHLGGAATNIDHHGTAGLADRQARANTGGHGRFDQVYRRGTCCLGGVLDGAALDLGGAAGHADDDARAGCEQIGRASCRERV